MPRVDSPNRMMAGKTGAPLLAHYAASKFAVVGFTQSLAKEVGPTASA